MIASSPSQSMLRPGRHRVRLVGIDDAGARRLGEEHRIDLVLIGLERRLLLRAAGREHLAGVQLVVRRGGEQVVGIFDRRLDRDLVEIERERRGALRLLEVVRDLIEPRRHARVLLDQLAHLGRDADGRHAGLLRQLRVGAGDVEDAAAEHQADARLPGRLERRQLERRVGLVRHRGALRAERRQEGDHQNQQRDTSHGDSFDGRNDNRARSTAVLKNRSVCVNTDTLFQVGSAGGSPHSCAIAAAPGTHTA